MWLNFLNAMQDVSGWSVDNYIGPDNTRSRALYLISHANYALTAAVNAEFACELLF